MENRLTAVITGMMAAIMAVLPWRPVLADSTWTVYNQTNSQLPSDYVSSIDFDSDGNQYIGTSGSGVAVIRESVWSVWNQSNTGVPINAVRRTACGAPGCLWLAAASGNLDSSPYGFGLARFDRNDSTWSLRNEGLEVNQIVTGVITDGQTRYVSTYGGGITIYNDAGWIRYRFNSRTEYTYSDGQQHVYNVPNGTYIPTDYIRAIDYDDQNNILWMATMNGGAVKYDGISWQRYSSANSGLPSNQLLSIRINQADGAVAIGTAGFGVAIFDNVGWSVYNPANSPLTNGFVSTLEYRPVNGELWIGTGYGVWVLQVDGQWRGYIPPDDNFIWGQFYSDIAFDSIGSVWVSAFGGGVATLFLDSIPDPPPTDDGLEIDLTRMFIYFYNNIPRERIFADLNVSGVPQLAAEDTVFFILESNLGPLYSFGMTFGDFALYDTTDGWDFYKYMQDRLKVFVRISQVDPSYAEISIKDFDADMNRDNYDDTMNLSMGLGSASGTIIINLTEGNQRYDQDYDEDENEDIDGNLNYVTVFQLVQPMSVDDDGGLPLAMRLNLANYPNPFNSSTVFRFKLDEDSYVRVAVYDMLGRMVDAAYSGYLGAGENSIVWNTRGEVKSGVYIYTVSVGDKSVSKKMTYLK